MKVYLAAPYSMKDAIKERARELLECGITVTSTWLNEPHAPNTQMGELTHKQHQKYALQDIDDVVAADMLVFQTDPTKTIVRGGRHVEFGIAVAFHKPIWVVGEEYENIFHHLNLVTHFKSWEDLKTALRALV